MRLLFSELALLLLAFSTLLSCAGSSSPSSSSSAPSELLVSISSAQKLGLTAGTDAISVLGIQTQSASESSDFRLVQVETVSSSTGSSVTKKVFNVSASSYFMTKINNIVIVVGQFSNIQWPDGVYSCYMISFSKTASNEKANCLSKLPIGSFSPTSGKSNAHYSKLGIRQRGNSLYFVSNDATSSYVYKWSDGYSAPSLILTKPFQGLGFEDIFLDNSGTNICVMAPAISSTVLYVGQVFCGTDASSNWSDVSSSLLASTAYILAETFQFDNLVASTDKKIDMTTLTVSARTAGGDNGGLPSGYANRTAVPGGGMIVRAYAGSISYFDASANTTVVADINSTSKYWFKVVGSGNYAWTYGGTDLNNESNGTALKRVNLTTHILEATDYFSQTGLTTISDLVYDADGSTIVVKGKNGSGVTSYAKIDSTGAVSSLATINSDLFSSLLSL